MRLTSRLLPGLIILLVSLQLVVPYRGWVTLVVALGGAWLVAYVWARSLAQGLRLSREQRFGWAQVGDQLEERFTLVNDSWLPALWFEVIDGSTLPDYRISRAMGVGGKSAVQWTTQSICARRGAFTLGPTTLRTSDPFGLYTVQIHNPARTALIVMPPVVPLPNIEVAPGGRAGEGRPRPNAPERTVAAATVRDYLPGDDLRWIHWPTSARHGSLYVRLFENTPAGDWWIFLDLDQRVQAGRGLNATEEHAVILAASLADCGLREGRSVGLVTHGETLVRLPPLAGRGQRMEILRALALVTPGRCSLAHLLARARPPLRECASLIVITPNAHGQWIESLMPLLWRGAVATVLLLDPVSFGGAGNAAWTMNALADLRVARYLITRDVLDRREAHPGHQGRWEWRIMPTGRAVPITRPGDMDWKALS